MWITFEGVSNILDLIANEMLLDRFNFITDPLSWRIF